MNDDLRADDPQQEVLNEVLAAYLEAIARGEAVDRHDPRGKSSEAGQGVEPFF